LRNRFANERTPSSIRYRRLEAILTPCSYSATQRLSFSFMSYSTADQSNSIFSSSISLTSASATNATVWLDTEPCTSNHLNCSLCTISPLRPENCQPIRQSRFTRCLTSS